MAIGTVTTSSAILNQIAQASVRGMGAIALGNSNTPINPKSLTWLQNAGSSIATVLYMATKASPAVSGVKAEEGANIANTIIDLIKRNAADQIAGALANGIAYLTHGFSIEGKVHRAVLNFLPNLDNSHDLVSMQLQDPSGFRMPLVSRPGHAVTQPETPTPRPNMQQPGAASHPLGSMGSNNQAAQLLKAAYSPYANIPPPPPLSQRAAPEQAASLYANLSPPPPLVPVKPKALRDELKASVNPLPLPPKPAGLSVAERSPPERQQLSSSQPGLADKARPSFTGSAPSTQVPIIGLNAWLDAQEHPTSQRSVSAQALTPPRPPSTAQALSRRLPPIPQAPRQPSIRQASSLPSTPQSQPPTLSSRDAYSTPLVGHPALAIALMNAQLGRQPNSVVDQGLAALDNPLQRRGATRLPSRQQSIAQALPTPAASEPMRRENEQPRVAFPPAPLVLNTAYISQNSGVKLLTPTELARCKVSIKDGTVVDADGGLYNTKNLARTSKGGSALFVMDVGGQVYVKHRLTQEPTDHSSFLPGQPVAAAGRITIVDGKVTALKLPKDTQNQYQTTDLHLQNVKIHLAHALRLPK